MPRSLYLPGDSEVISSCKLMLFFILYPFMYFLVLKGIMAMPDIAVQALALTIRHLKQYGFERILCLRASFRPYSGNTEMTLSANAMQQLEVYILHHALYS